VSRARLAVVEQALFDSGVFQTAAQIQTPAKNEVLSFIRFFNAKVERPADTHKQIVAVYGDIINREMGTSGP
jgi:hypothetical protein